MTRYDPDRHRPITPAPERADLARGMDNAVRAFFPAATTIAAIPGSPHLARLEDPSGTWAVRRWKAGTPAERPHFVHAALAMAGSDLATVVPTVRPLADGSGNVLTLAGHHHDAVSWLPGRLQQRVGERLPEGGQINLPAALPSAVAADLVRTVARFHRATEPLARRSDVPTVTLATVAAVVNRAWPNHLANLRAYAARTPDIQRWIRAAERVVPAAAAALETAQDLWKEQSVVGHHDLWPAHVLLPDDGGTDRIAGLLDFEDVAAGSPLLDLAHLVGHFGGWNADAAEVVLGAYHEVRPLTPAHRRLFSAVVALDLVNEAGWLLAAAHRPRRLDDAPASSALKSGAAALVASLEIVAPVVLLGDAPTPKRTRTWVHRSGDDANRPPGARPNAPARVATRKRPRGKPDAR